MLAVTHLLYHMSRIFEDHPLPRSSTGLHVDRKRRQKLQAKRIALGRKLDHHNEEQNQGGMTIGGMRSPLKNCKAVNKNSFLVLDGQLVTFLTTDAAPSVYWTCIMIWCVADKAVTHMNDYMRALHARFYREPELQRARKELEQSSRKVKAMLVQQNKETLLRLADLENELQEETSQTFFITGFQLGMGIAGEIGPYCFEDEEEKQATDRAKMRCPQVKN